MNNYYKEDKDMKQKFRFAELYRRNRTAVEKTLSAMWCGEARNESQKGYVAQLTKIIPKVFAPKDAMPLVQCMNSYETLYQEHEAEAEEMVGELWRKTLQVPIFENGKLVYKMPSIEEIKRNKEIQKET